MTSIYGYDLYKKRYCGHFPKYFQEQLDYLSAPLQTLLNVQQERLQKIIHHAYNNVPYYRELFDKIHLTPQDIKCDKDLAKIPILEKSVVREKPHSLLAINLKRNKFIIEHTSGTTGTPLDVYNTSDSLQFSHALEFFVRSVYGLSLKTRKASFIGRIIVPHHQTKPPFWHFNFILNQYLFSSYHMSDDNLPFYIHKLEEFQPEEIVGYPSSIYTLAQFIVKNNIKNIHPKMVFGNSEPILTYQREVMHKAFNCPVREWYSSTEHTFFAYECPEQNYHIVHPFGIVEVVDKYSNPVPNGTTGELITTGLMNYAMPLIRYRLGDTASIGAVDCSCGNKSMVFRNILGRSDDILLTPDGRNIGRLDPVFKGLSGIKESQIIQKSRDVIILKIVKDKVYSATDENKLIQSLKKRIGTHMKIQVEYVYYIPRDANGKFRSVISEVKPI